MHIYRSIGSRGHINHYIELPSLARLQRKKRPWQYPYPIGATRFKSSRVIKPVISKRVIIPVAHRHTHLKFPRVRISNKDLLRRCRTRSRFKINSARANSNTGLAQGLPAQQAKKKEKNYTITFHLKTHKHCSGLFTSYSVLLLCYCISNCRSIIAYSFSYIRTIKTGCISNLEFGSRRTVVYPVKGIVIRFNYSLRSKS